MRRSEEAAYGLVARSDKLVRCLQIHKTFNGSEGDMCRDAYRIFFQGGGGGGGDN